MRPELRHAVMVLQDTLHMVTMERLAPRAWVIGPARADTRRIARFMVLMDVLDALLRAIYDRQPADLLDIALDRIGRELADLCLSSTPWTWWTEATEDDRFAVFGPDDLEPGLTVHLLFFETTEDERREVVCALHTLLGVLLGAEPHQDRSA